MRLTLLGSVSYSSGNPMLLTKELDRDVNDFAWSQDSKSLYFIATADGGFPLNRVDASGGKIQRLTESKSGLRNLAVGAKSLVFTLTEVANPYEAIRIKS